MYIIGTPLQFVQGQYVARDAACDGSILGYDRSSASMTNDSNLSTFTSSSHTWRDCLERSFGEHTIASLTRTPDRPLFGPDGALMDPRQTPVTLNSLFQWPLQVGSPMYVYILEHYDLRL